MQLYYVAQVLPEELNHQVRAMKQWMLEQFGCKVALKSPAHITLLPPFKMLPALENDFRDELQAWAATCSPFPIRTNNFGAFGQRTLFADVLVDEPLATLKHSCDEWFRRKTRYGVKIESRPFHPHITIANRDIPRTAFPEAWAHFSARTFRETWTANAVHLLRHNGGGWDVVLAAPMAT